MKILITGKTGVGKSKLLEKYNHHSIDQQNRDVWMKSGSEYYDYIKNEFGEKYVSEKQINNQELGKLLFNNKEALDKVNNFVVPIVKNWIMSLPENSLIEFAQYIDHENKYKNLFDKVILIKNTDPKLSDKFIYLGKEHQPISNNEIKADYVIDNTNFNGQKKFDELINKLKDK